MDGASGKSQLSIRLPAEMVESFDRIAAVLDRDRSWVLLRALKRYLDTEGADVLRDAAGIAELDRGEGHDFDDVMAEAEAIVARAEAGRARKAV